MKNIATTLFFALSLMPAAHAATEFTHCRIEGSDAVGYFCVRNGASSESGKATLNVYNKSGKRLNSTWKVAVKVVINDCKEVIRTAVASDAFYCDLIFPD